MSETPAADPLRIIFAGTPEFAVPSLDALMASAHEVVAVYTQPDRPAGRGRRLQPCAVRQASDRYRLCVRQPATLRDDDTVEALRGLRPDLMVVAAYGLLLPKRVLEIPRLGCINVHASLLPRWRGAAPIQYAILSGDAKTGVTLMQMDAGLDTGAMLAQAEMPLDEHTTAGELTAALARLGGELLGANLEAIAARELIPVPQEQALVTHAPKIVKHAATIDWHMAASDIARAVRAYDPWPVAQTTLAGQQLRLWRASALRSATTGAPGRVVSAGGNSFEVVCGQGILSVTEVQPAGRRRMAVRDFLNANDLDGVVLGCEPEH